MERASTEIEGKAQNMSSSIGTTNSQLAASRASPVKVIQVENAMRCSPLFESRHTLAELSRHHVSIDQSSRLSNFLDQNGLKYNKVHFKDQEDRESANKSKLSYIIQSRRDAQTPMSLPGQSKNTIQSNMETNLMNNHVHFNQILADLRDKSPRVNMNHFKELMKSKEGHQ